MRRFRALLAVTLAAWLPIDAAVAGWWHRHHPHPMPFVPGPMLPCGAPPAPWAGWGGAVVIDDRPLHPPMPVFSAPAPTIVVGHAVETIHGHPLHFAEVPAGGIVVEGSTTGEWPTSCECDSGEVVVTGDAFPVSSEHAVTVVPIEVEAGLPAEASGAVVIDHGTEPATATAPSRQVETAPEAPTPLEIPDTRAPEIAPAPETVAPAGSAPDSVLEPWEPTTVQGESGAAALDDEGFEPPADAAMEATDETAETMEEEGFEAPAPRPAPPARPRNLFDEVPQREVPADPPAGETPPADAFEAPADDDGFGIPDEPPMDEAPPEFPADEPTMDDPPADEGGFEGPADEPMDDGGEPMDEEGVPADDAPPADEPESADPFDSSSIRTPDEPSRTWRDDTGRHSTVGRLVEIRAGHVRILKANGRHTTVPMERLSAADRRHVAGVRQATTVRPATGDTAGIR